MSSKRHSILPPVSQAGPKPPVHFSSSVTIADSALLTGTGLIEVGAESVVHPRARLESLAGRVTVGRRCVVQERTVIGAPPSTSSRVTAATTTEAAGAAPVAVKLGDYVTVEVGASIEAGDTAIGEGTTVGVGAKVGAGAVIGKVSSGSLRCVCLLVSCRGGGRVADYAPVLSTAHSHHTPR